MIVRVTATEVLEQCRRTVGMSEQQNSKLDDTLLAALIRRSAGIHCPCSRATLRASLLECVRGLPTSYDSLREAIDDAIEALIVGGDLLELNDVVIDDSNVRQTWVFAAPPSFVVRPSGSTFLFGIVPDQDTFLPSNLTARISYRGYTRVIEHRDGDNFLNELIEFGLQQRSERAWLKSPCQERPDDLIGHHQRILKSQPPNTEIPDLEILDSERSVTYYRGRWTKPTGQSDIYVGRRPQEFGAPIWCLVDLINGEPARFLDLPLARYRWRGCDAAWHLQAAIDSIRGTPQRYRRRDEENRARFDFFSPLPQWSQRRLMILGKSVSREKCLFSYVIPASEADAEEEFLQKNLWLAPSEDSH